MKYNKQVSVGYDLDGRRVRKWIHANSEQELKRKEKELLQKTETELLPSVRFGDYARQWFATYKTNRETRTQEYYLSGLKKLQGLDYLELSRIRRTHLQQIIAQNWAHPRTCKKIVGIMSQIFRAAIADGLINRNPAEGLELPKKRKNKKRILTTAEKEAVSRAQLPEPERLFLDLIRSLGLRPEEARALTRSAVNFKDKTISITQAAIFNDNAPELKGTKNGEHRTLPLPDGLLEALKAHPGMILFPGRDGRLMTKSAYRLFQKRIFNAINAELGGNDSLNLLNGMTFYTMRHTKGTELYYLTQEGKISTKLAAEYMGHSEIVFLSTYSHIDYERESMETLRAVTNL